MKVLWLCNLMLPEIAKAMNENPSYTGGWMTGLLSDLQSQSGYQFAVCFPMTHGKMDITGNTGKLQYYGFSFKSSLAEQIGALEKRFIEILNDYQPDVVHIFGTEYAHTLAMLEAGEKIGIAEKMVVSIQGMVSVYAQHYYGGIPTKDIFMFSLRDIIKRDNVYLAARDFQRRGKLEARSIELCRNVIGRTDWDKACTEQINKDVRYFYCSETLRDVFYKNRWSIKNCKRHSIFASQWYNPIKGFHHVLYAIKILSEVYPDVHVYTTGNNPLDESIEKKMRRSHYANYIGKLIRQYRIENNVTFLGALNAEEMCKAYMNAHVFVSASSIENSPNSLGEAMMLGVPTVSSDVGGVKNMLTHEQEGYIYPFDEPYMLAYYIGRIFANDECALVFSENAKQHAAVTHSKQKNSERTCQIYNWIYHGTIEKVNSNEAYCSDSTQ